MPKRRAARSAISLVAVVALLLCQATWAGMRAPQRMALGMHAAGFTLAPSCHDLGDSDVPANAAPSPCDSAQLPSDGIKPPVFAAAALDVAFVVFSAPERHSWPARVELAHPAGVPPPLRLLHCRFRN